MPKKSSTPETDPPAGVFNEIAFQSIGSEVMCHVSDDDHKICFRAYAEKDDPILTEKRFAWTPSKDNALYTIATDPQAVFNYCKRHYILGEEDEKWLKSRNAQKPKPTAAAVSSVTVGLEGGLETVLRVLNEALKADPAAISALFSVSVPCNTKLANHATVQVRVSDDLTLLSVIGVLNGIIEPLLGARVAAEYDLETQATVKRFVAYQKPTEKT